MKKILLKLKERSPLEIGLAIVLLFQLAASVYFNLALLSCHMGYDSSWSYLKAALIWREKSLVSDVWIDQTSVFLDSSMLPAALLYGLTDNLFLSYGIANCMVLLLIMVCADHIMKSFGCEIRERLICVNLLICPYLTNGFGVYNDLGYFNDLISGPAFYGVRVLLFLLIIKVFLDIEKNHKMNVWAWLSFLLCFVAGMSSGVFIIVMILLPYLIYEFERAMLENTFRMFRETEAVYAYLCCIFVIAGRIFGKAVLGIHSIDASRCLSSIERIWNNMGAVIQGLMKLLGVLPILDTGIPVMSAEGVFRIFPILIFAIVIIALVYHIRKICKDPGSVERKTLFVCNIVICNFLMFSLFNVSYGSPIFEERYLICTYMAIIILIGCFLKGLNRKFLATGFLYAALLVGICGTDLVSDWRYVTTTNDNWQMAEITGAADQYDAKLVYVWGDSVNPLGRSLRAYDLSRVYKCIGSAGGYDHWGDYLYYEQNEEYDGSTLLIVSKLEQCVPEEILNQYVPVGEFDTVYLYMCTYNPIDPYAGS